jgi:hypothetical protein
MKLIDYMILVSMGGMFWGINGSEMGGLILFPILLIIKLIASAIDSKKTHF